jgi:hypothetical protein
MRCFAVVARRTQPKRDRTGPSASRRTAHAHGTGASGEKLLRADSGFWNKKIMNRLQTAGWTYSIGIRQQSHVKAAVEEIPELGLAAPRRLSRRWRGADR